MLHKDKIMFLNQALYVRNPRRNIFSFLIPEVPVLSTLESSRGVLSPDIVFVQTAQIAVTKGNLSQCETQLYRPGESLVRRVKTQARHSASSPESCLLRPTPSSTSPQIRKPTFSPPRNKLQPPICQRGPWTKFPAGVPGPEQCSNILRTDLNLDPPLYREPRQSIPHHPPQMSPCLGY